MLTLRYTRWDGRQRVRLDADLVFERLEELLSYADDVQQAFEWLARRGCEGPDAAVAGLDEYLEAVRARLRARYDAYDLSRALDAMRQKLDALLERERTALEARAAGRPEIASKLHVLDRLPAGLVEAIEALRRYAFEDRDAAQQYAALLGELEAIRKLADFRRRKGQLFRGPEAVDYPRALELVAEIEALQQLEQQLMGGDPQAVTPDLVERMLGAEAARDFEGLRAMMMSLRESGYLAEREGRVILSPKGARKIGQLALRDIYVRLQRDRAGGHATGRRGSVTVRPEVSTQYQYGDPLHLDVVGTLRRAIARGSGTPVRLLPDDFTVHGADDVTSTSTVLLLDMSWSMSWEGRFAAAKRVALAMEALVRACYPRDYFAVVGFFTRAVELGLRELPEATWNMGDPFTNLQDGLRLGADLLRRHRSPNQHMIVITDGQPTAYCQGGRLYCEWPLSFGGISARAARETLKEVERVTRMRVTINTFMLDDSPSLRAFVEQMTRLNRGRAFYTRPDRLGEYLLVDYVNRKRKKI